MNAIKFNLEQLLLEKRKTAVELSRLTKKNYSSIWFMVKNKKIQMPFFRQLESHFGDCSKYIIKSDNISLNVLPNKVTDSVTA